MSYSPAIFNNAIQISFSLKGSKILNEIMINVFQSSLDEIRHELILKYQKENIFKSTYHDWFNLFGNLFSGYATNRYDLNPYQVFRARINFDFRTNRNIDFFKNVNELIAPGPKFIKKIGRCNAQNESIFYCSTDPYTALFEINPNANQEFTIIEFKLNKKFENLNVIGIYDLSQISYDLSNLFKNHYKFKGADREYIDKLFFIDDFLSNEFKRIIPMHESYFYKITLGITKYFLNDNKIDEPGIKSANPSNGIVYPSVALAISGINLAIKPKYAYTCIKPDSIMKFKIIDKPDIHNYKIKRTHKSTKIKSNGDIIWFADEGSNEYITDL